MKRQNQAVLNDMFNLIQSQSNIELPQELKNEIKVLLSKEFRTEKNFFLLTDFYKQTHWLQYPKGTTEVYSYYENRKSLFPKQLFFGLSYILQAYMEGEVVKQWMVDEAKEHTNAEGGFEYFNVMGAQRIIDVHKGHLPLEIRAVDEGSLVPTSNVLFTIRNTDPELPYLTNYVESLLMHVYSTIGTATLSFYIRKCAEKWGKITGATIHPYFVNDFGFRGASSVETAEKNGGAHLLIFAGSDNQSAQKWLIDYYDAPIVLASVFATEHSTSTIKGKDFEKDKVKMWLETQPSAATLSFVIDSYNWKNFITHVLGDKEIKHLILNRTGKIVARPDSGTPWIVAVKCLQLLADTFGYTWNDNGYKVLNPRVGLIYGDGINYHSINTILEAIVNADFCVSNIVFGMGGALLQQIERDTHATAIKCSSAVVEGVRFDVGKDPIDGGKKSKLGELKLHPTETGSFMTISTATTERSAFNSYADALKLVYKNGVVLIKPKYAEIKARVEEAVEREPAEYYPLVKLEVA